MVFNFTNAEVHRLIEIFKKLDKDGTGSIQKSELFEMPYFKNNPFKDRWKLDFHLFPPNLHLL